MRPMWTCRACGLSMLFRAIQPEVDEDGPYFLCVGCRARNALVNIAGHLGEIVLKQPEA